MIDKVPSRLFGAADFPYGTARAPTALGASGETASAAHVQLFRASYLRLNV
ncbi:MAG: hypothetical protein V7704_03140 [Aurantimonas endophytica]|uniref:Uncharacterized protein n=1 Tax=Aurantimonas endophytica TaxID=1522175 RepID=A0A7W6HGI4_9HYPH|nr:hypothetical protein [Aurantimonas endophytica]MBB4004791.1 hypothetical protein [Aurantimonas endophytica]MCO6405601.1 hypothetical protein [Aurantimonas endophytica]